MPLPEHFQQHLHKCYRDYRKTDSGSRQEAEARRDWVDCVNAVVAHLNAIRPPEHPTVKAHPRPFVDILTWGNASTWGPGVFEADSWDGYGNEAWYWRLPGQEEPHKPMAPTPAHALIEVAAAYERMVVDLSYSYTALVQPRVYGTERFTDDALAKLAKDMIGKPVTSPSGLTGAVKEARVTPEGVVAVIALPRKLKP